MSFARKLTYLGAATAFQWLPRSAVLRYQLRALGRLLAFCERQVPLYRETFRARGVQARDLRSLADLAHFPILSREEVVAAYPEGICSRRPRPEDVVFRTSGTSGLFMEIAYSAAANDRLDAIYGRALFNAGYRPWDRIAYFWEEPRRQRRIYEKLGLMEKSYLRVSPRPQENVEQLLALDPQVIYGFPSSLMIIARLVEREAISGIRPRTIICHGEHLAPEIQRELSRVFRCPVRNQYGAQEFNRMGWDCAAGEPGTLHLDADSVVLEVLDGERPLPAGQEGELVISGLQNELMPLVRYRIGDAGCWLERPCRCGRGLPLFQITEGRMDDILILPDGGRIGPRTLAPRIERLRGFTQYRVIQRRPDRVEVVLVRDGGGPETLRQVETTVAQTLGSSVSVTARWVDSISLSRRGKLRKIVSEVAR